MIFGDNMLAMARPRRSGITEAGLSGLYINHGLSQSECAERFGVTQSAIYYYMKTFGISARPTEESNPKEIILDAAELRRLYCDDKMTMRDISKRFGCGYSTIRNTLLEIGIDPYSKGFRKKYFGPGVSSDRGYAEHRTVGHPKASKKGHYVPEHRLVVEKVIGRYLTADEHVHHINVRRECNEIENLAVLDSSQHARVHKYMCHVAAYLCYLTDIRPEALDFGAPVFWGGKYITTLDLISDGARRDIAEAVVDNIADNSDRDFAVDFERIRAGGIAERIN